MSREKQHIYAAQKASENFKLEQLDLARSLADVEHVQKTALVSCSGRRPTLTHKLARPQCMRTAAANLYGRCCAVMHPHVSQAHTDSQFVPCSSLADAYKGYRRAIALFRSDLFLFDRSRDRPRLRAQHISKGRPSELRIRLGMAAAQLEEPVSNRLHEHDTEPT